MSGSSGIPTAWDRFWFAPVRPEWLAVCRMVVAASLLIYLLRRLPWVETSILGVIPRLPHELWQPVSYMALLGIGPPSTTTVIAVWTVTLVAAIALLVGAGTRVAAVVAALGGLYLIALPFCFGKVNHDMNVVAIALMIVPFAPTGATLSVDAHLRRVRDAATGPPAKSGAYNWPVKLLQLSFALMLFFAGWHKIQRSGLDWITTENLRTILVHHNLVLREGYVSPFVAPVVENPAIWHTVAAAVVVSEICFILIVFVRRWWLRGALLAGGAGFVLGLLVFMGFWNPETLVLLAMFLDWNRLLTRVRSPGTAPPRVIAPGAPSGAR